MNTYKSDFPILAQKIRNKPWVYLDSAATALKPWSVIEKISHFYTYQTANVHRGSFFLSDQATQLFEESREKVRQFLNASSVEEIIFTKGATESINLVASSYASHFLKEGDEILLSEMEHHSNIVPWQVAAQKTGARIVVIAINDKGEIDYSDFQKKINNKTKILAITHCSNVLGTVNDIKKMSQLAHQFGAKVFVDGAQMVANFKVDVKELDVDFYCFSGHKIFGPYGIGVLYGKKEILNLMPPYQSGGSMISEVKFEKTQYNTLPFYFEAGTPHIEGVIGLGAAIDYIQNIGHEKIEQVESALLKSAMEKMRQIPDVKIFGDAEKRAPIISFSFAAHHSSDVASILDQENVFVRSGHLCAQPLMRKLNAPGFVRASFSIFNQQQDIDRLISSILKAKEILQ